MSKSFSSALFIIWSAFLCCIFLQNSAFAQAGDFTRFDTQTSFITANPSPTIVSYDSIANGRLPTYEYTFATEGVKVKPNDPNYTLALFVSEWSSLLPGKEIAITGKEGMEFNFITPVNAFGYDFVEPTTCLPWFCPTTFIDSTFVISIYSGATKLTEYTFTPANNVATFFWVSSAQSFDKIVIQETDGGVDDEVYGKLYIKRNPPAPTCGNPRAQVNFVPYVGIPAADQNSSTNAWDSITLGNKAVVAGGTFFDVTDGTNAIDDGTIVSAGLQNFAVSRHNGYIEFLALGRRLSTYYGYYQGTIKLENVQVDRVEPGLTTATWADIGLEAVEGDTVTKVSDNEVSFKLAFANQGDGFRVYLKNPTPTECTCPTGQEKKPDPKSPVCIVRARVDGVQDTTVTLTGYGHLAGECTVAGIVLQAPQTPSPNLVVTAGQQRVGWAQSSPWTFQLDPLLTCPANTTKTACMFTYGAGPLGEITCGCYPNGFTTKTFTDPLVQGRPVYSRDGSPAQFCREQWYTERALVKRVENLIGAWSLWNGQVWEINQNLEIIKEVECSNEPNTICRNFYEPRVHGKPVFARNASPAQFCREQGYDKSATVNKEYSYEWNGSLWNGSVWEINLNLAAIREVNCCQLEDKSSSICVNAGCAAGQYWCQAENMCKPAGQSCSAVTCNNNNTCEAGESCNCGDCTNGGTDDADKCGLSNNAQMVCTKDVKNTTTSLTPTTQKWVAYTYPGYASSYIYISKLPTETHTVAGQTFYVYNPERVIRGMSEATFMANPEEAIKNAPVIAIGNTRWTERLIFNIAQLQSETSATQTSTLNALTSSVAHRYMCTENVVGATNCSNNSDMGWTPGFGKAQGGDIYVSASNSGGGVAFAKGQILGTFDVANTTCQLFKTSSVRYIPNGTNSNIGWTWVCSATVYTDNGKTICQILDATDENGATISRTPTAQEEADFLTRGGKLSAEIKIVSSGTTASPTNAVHLMASYLELSVGQTTAADGTVRPRKRFTLTLGMDSTRTPTVYGFTDADYDGTTPFKYTVTGGADKYNLYEMVYDPATHTVDVFVNGVERISNYPGNAVSSANLQSAGNIRVYFGSGSSAWVATTNYGNIALVVKNNCPGSAVQVGACCPAGAQWDSSQGKCLTACEPIVTLKQGSDLTTIKNPQGEAFSTNTTCANKNISLSPCNTTMGVVADGTSPSGNKLYKWPKTASGLTKDYNLVEINGQCWFADNLEEKPSAVPTPPGAWDNFSPHNDYGLYTFTGTGVGRSEGYLYQFDAATNMVLPAGAPADRQQWVCPAGWHVATDCEFQYVEHTLGMSVAEQQAVGSSRTSGDVGTDLKTGGDSGFDMPLSGTRRFNTGFINGLGEGHLWSSECPSTGCYKRIVDSTGTVTRIQGGGAPYDSAHHAAGSVRCVKDGSTTPVNTCPVPGCAEGEYYCHAELKCKAAGASCGAITCNNNNVCDANESCDCADCNDKVDHCGLSSAGEQMICTKDTAEKCYTDKFPYCLSACLDGYKMDANGQCIPVAPVWVPQSCTVRGVQGIEWSVALCNAGEVRVGGGCENTNGGAYRFFTFPLVKGETWWNYTNVAENGWACGSGSTGTYTKSYAICCSAPTTWTYEIRKGAPGIGSKAECLAGEVRTGGGCKNLGGSAFLPVSYPLAAWSTFGSLGTVTNDGWWCATGASDTTTEAYAICYNPGTGPSFATTIRTQAGVELATAECLAGEVRTGGGCSLLSGTAYHYAIFPSIAGVFNGYGTPTNDGFVCATGSTGTYTQAYAVCASKASNNSWTSTTGSQNFSYPVKIDGYVKNDAASATKFCTEKWFTSATIVSSDSSGVRKMGWNGTSWVADNSGWSYIKLLTCSGGTPQNYTCQSYTGNIQTHGGYLSIQPQSTTQFCKEAGYDFPQLTAQYSTSSSCRLWNGTSWYEDVACVAASGLQCCTNPTTPAWNTSSTEPQLWACCPPGSAWNSVENRCIPTTCGEGQFYCAAQKKCLAGGQTCDTAVCNNDGVCSGEESCQCGDCVNGGGDDKDKCSIVGGTQAMCSDDNLADNKPGACCVPPKKWNTATSSCVECSNTQAPSELKAGVDQPYITCTGNGDTTKTHFKYRVTKQGTTDAPFISELYTVGTSVLHPTMTLGDYTVECFYGNATGVDTSATATPHSCIKTMSVKSDAQGCSRVYPYKWSTLSDEMTSASAFDASFRCGSRKPVAGTITNPYMFRVGTQPVSYLAFDALISELFNGLTIGPVSTQTQNYNFDTGNTDVTCATKVGGGYSTNTACQLRTCVGGACNVPQTFSVVHSDDLICTTEETSTYNIGCNPAAPDSVRNQCIQWFRDAVNAGSRNISNGVEFNVSFAFNTDAPTNVTCIKYVAGQMPGGLNLSDNVVCRATLKNGEKYQIYAADTNGRIDALQTTAKTVERDREAPTMAEIKYYTDETLTTEIPSTQWYNKPVIALAVCSDTPLNEATSCACAQRVDATTTDADAWSLGVPNSLIGADLMRYTRTITETLTGTQKVQVVDTAGNTSTAKNITVSLDTQAPLVTPTESGTGTTRTITLTASDTGSKIWKTTSAPSGATNTSGIIYRVGPKADMATLAFDAACNTTPTYATVTETQSSSFPSQATATISNLNTATQVVAYCVRDNAGNTTRGMYPVITNACFSATNMPTIPTFDTYKALLKTRLTATGTDNQKYGYSFSENTADASCFRGILSTNITTLMTNQLKPRTSTTLSNWDLDRAELSTSTTLSNGYYYYVYSTSNTLNIVTSPTGGAPVKSVVVEWGDIRIKTDINYSGTGKTLLLIARKNSNGQGGNIIIDTNVKNIDAILIADGWALRSSDATLPGERLTINGRLYSYNTRGGSLTVSGTDFVDSTTPKKFTNSNLVSASSLNDARIQDLERFRPIFADGNNTCSLVVNHQVFTTANLPALLKRPNTFTGGSCGF